MYGRYEKQFVAGDLPIFPTAVKLCRCAVCALDDAVAKVFGRYDQDDAPVRVSPHIFSDQGRFTRSGRSDNVFADNVVQGDLVPVQDCGKVFARVRC